MQTGGTSIWSDLSLGVWSDGNGAYDLQGGSQSVLGSLAIAAGTAARGHYTLANGNLHVAGSVTVGGSATSKGGTGTFTISGGGAAVDSRLTIWNGSTAHLGAGTLVDSDSNHPYLDVDNSGMLYIEDGVYCFGRVQGIGNTLTGTIVVESGATLWVESIRQDSLIVEAGGTVHFAAEDYDLFVSLALANQSHVPEPGSLLLLALGGLVLARRRRRA